MDQEHIWDHFQNEGRSSFDGSHARMRFLARLVPSAARVLNVGIGAGYLEQILLEKVAHVHALDPNERTVERLRREMGMHETAKVGYSRAIPFADEAFDIVIMSEVLEHLGNQELAQSIDEVHRVLRQGGEFVGTVPAREILEEHRVVCPGCKEQFHRWGHVQSFNLQRVRSLLNTRFSVEQVFEKAFSSHDSTGLRGLAFGFARSALFKLRLGPYGKNANICFVAKRQ